MSKQPTYDLPPASSNGSQPLLLDANAGNYSTLPNGGGIVFIERYAIRKPFVRRQAINTTSNIRPETYLVKETNYTDVGGGWFEFERHYAEVPASWFDFQLVAVTTAWFGGVLVADYVVNPQFSGGFQRTTSVLAKVTRNYYLKENIPTNLNLNAPQLLQIGGFSDSRTFVDAIVRADDVSVYLGQIYEVASFRATVTVSSPRLN